MDWVGIYTLIMLVLGLGLVIGMDDEEKFWKWFFRWIGMVPLVGRAFGWW